MYSKGENWKRWMHNFRFGTLAFLPTGDLRTTADQLRAQYDPVSARICAAHVTITQPLSQAPDASQVSMIENVVSGFARFAARIGPATTSPNQRLVWLDVNPKEQVLAIRNRLHETGLFRTDLPFTTGFIPHLTISEKQRDAEEVRAIHEKLNAEFAPW